MLYFTQRKRLGELAREWCYENGVLQCAESYVSFLVINGLIDEDKTKEFLNKDKEKHNAEN